jgi:cholesterol transport system auxiliary component
MSWTADPVFLRRLSGVLAVCVALSACSVLDKPTRALVYDFGPGLPSGAQTQSVASRPSVVLAQVAAHSALDSTAILYRLAYADEQRLLPYAQARWSMPPAQLLHLRLRETLAQRFVVLREGEGAAGGSARPLVLHLELDEFSQLFETPGTSLGLVHVHASVMRPTASGDRLLAQRDFTVRRGAPSADAACWQKLRNG